MKVADLFALLSLKPDSASFTKTQKLLDGAKTALKAVAGATIAATAVAGKLIHDTAQAADQFAKMSKQVGISVEKLQQLEFAAKISGTDLGVLRTGLQRFARTADDAGQGLKTALEPFERLGVETRDAEGNLRDLDSLLLSTADAISKMPDGTEKTALAMKAFGRAGAQLIPLLNEGSTGIDALRKEFTGLGAEISGEQAKAFEGYNDTILRIKTALIGFRNQAVIKLLPHLKSTVATVLEWFKANRELIKLRINQTLKALGVILGSVATVVGYVVKNFEALAITLGIAKTASLAYAAAQAVAAAGSIRAALASAAAWVAASAPILLIVLLLGLLYLIVQDIWVAFQGGDSVLKDLFNDLVGYFTEPIENWVSDIKAFWKFLVDGFKDAFDKVTDVGSNVIDSLLPDFVKPEVAVAGAVNADVIRQRKQAAFDAAQAAVRVSSTEPTLPTSQFGGGAGLLTSNLTVNVAAGASVDEEAITRIGDANDAALRRAARAAGAEGR